jgi:hypothetical protein
MKNQLTILILFFSFNPTLFGQFNDTLFNQKIQMKVRKTDYSWRYKNIFLDFKLGVGSEFFYEPPKTYYYVYTTPYDTINFDDIAANFTIPIVNFTLEPRINLKSNSKSAYFIKAPITFGASVFINREIANIHTGKGGFNLTLPLLVGYAKGLNSTYSNCSDWGYALSIGYQLYTSPLVGAKNDYYNYDYHNGANASVQSIGDIYKFQRTHFMPLIQFDYYHYNLKNKIRGFSFAFCPVGNVYFKAAMNFVGTKK